MKGEFRVRYICYRYEFNKDSYDSFTFFLERDIVWTVQNKFQNTIEAQGVLYKVYNNFPIEKVHNFEPSKYRTDICTHKLPVVFWSEVLKDINRIEAFTKSDKAKTSVAVLIDEGSRVL